MKLIFRFMMLLGAFCSLGAEEAAIVDQLKGIKLLGEWHLVQSEVSETGVHAVNLKLLSNSFLRSLDRQFVGKPLTKELIAAIKQTIVDFYAKNHQPLVVVTAPKQELTLGVLQLVVTEARLGEVRVKGNEYFSNTQISDYIRTKPGQVIESKKVREDLAFMNQNPFRRTDAVFVPGMRPGVTDLELVTIDQWPYRIYAGFDNTGTISTNRDRIFVGLNLGKTIIKDTEVSVQYTQAPNFDRYYSLSGLVRVPLPWLRHTLQAFGGYAVVQPDSGVPALNPMGKSWSVDLRYRIPIFERTTDFLQNLVFGYDFKESNTNLFFGGESDYFGIADINQFMIGFDLGVASSLRKVNFTAELYMSPSSMTNHNNSESYQKLRYAANATYAYLKVTQSFAQKFSGWRFSYDLTGQIASTNLLPSEQLSMTGYHAVRGFEERILDLDNGGILNVSMETPRVSLARYFGWKKTYDELYALAFFDTGAGCNHKLTPGEPGFQSLGSIGPGLRYEFSRYCSAHLDYGFQLWHNGFNSETNSRYNFGLIISY